MGLRDGRHFSVILGIFANVDFATTVTLAQVFRTRDSGQPERFYAVADTELSITANFADFGTDLSGLRRRLRDIGVRIYDSFPDYGKDFRRRLGIESEQAMELFHQTVSMKSVDNLNDFVRSHMLEPFDSKAADRLPGRSLRQPDPGPRRRGPGPRPAGPAGAARGAAGGVRPAAAPRRPKSPASRRPSPITSPA